MQQKSWITTLEESPENPDELILTIPEEILEMKDWKEGTILTYEIESTPSGNVIVIKEKQK